MTGIKREEEQAEKFTIEENFAKLEKTIEQLESGEISLEEAFTAYSEGMKLVKECNDQLDKVEKQVLKLTEEGTLEPFSTDM